MGVTGGVRTIFCSTHSVSSCSSAFRRVLFSVLSPSSISGVGSWCE